MAADSDTAASRKVLAANVVNELQARTNAIEESLAQSSSDGFTADIRAYVAQGVEGIREVMDHLHACEEVREVIDLATTNMQELTAPSGDKEEDPFLYSDEQMAAIERRRAEARRAHNETSTTRRNELARQRTPIPAPAAVERQTRGPQQGDWEHHHEDLFDGMEHLIARADGSSVTTPSTTEADRHATRHVFRPKQSKSSFGLHGKVAEQPSQHRGFGQRPRPILRSQQPTLTTDAGHHRGSRLMSLVPGAATCRQISSPAQTGGNGQAITRAETDLTTEAGRHRESRVMSLMPGAASMGTISGGADPGRNPAPAHTAGHGQAIMRADGDEALTRQQANSSSPRGSRSPLSDSSSLSDPFADFFGLADSLDPFADLCGPPPVLADSLNERDPQRATKEQLASEEVGIGKRKRLQEQDTTREAGGGNITGSSNAASMDEVSGGRMARVAVERCEDEGSTALDGDHEADTDGESAEEGSGAAKRHKQDEGQDATIDGEEEAGDSRTEQAKRKWLVANMSNEDDEKWRCAAPGCTKLFKESKFLTKHLLNKHYQHFEESLKQMHAVAVAKLHHRRKDLLDTLGEIKALCKKGDPVAKMLNSFPVCHQLLDILHHRVDDIKIVEITMESVAMLMENYGLHLFLGDSVGDREEYQYLIVNYLSGIRGALTHHSGIYDLHRVGLRALGDPFIGRVEWAWPVSESALCLTLGRVVASMRKFAWSFAVQQAGCRVIGTQLTPAALTPEMCDAVMVASRENFDDTDVHKAVLKIVTCSWEGAKMMNERGFIDRLHALGRLCDWSIVNPLSKQPGAANKLFDAGICAMFKTTEYTSRDEDMLGTMTQVCLGDHRSHEPIVSKGICEAVASSLQTKRTQPFIREATGFIRAMSVCEAARTRFIAKGVPARLCKIMVESADVVQPCARALVALQPFDLDEAHCGDVLATLKKHVDARSRSEICAVLRSLTAVARNRSHFLHAECFQALAEVIRKGEAGADDAWWSLIALIPATMRFTLLQWIPDIDNLACKRLTTDDEITVAIMSATVFRPFKDDRRKAFVTKVVDWIAGPDADITRMKASCRLLAYTGIGLVSGNQRPLLLTALYEKLRRFIQDEDLHQDGWNVVRILNKVSYVAIPTDLLIKVLDTFKTNHRVMELLFGVLADVMDRQEMVLSLEQQHGLVSRITDSIASGSYGGRHRANIVLSLLMHGSQSTKETIQSSKVYGKVRENC